MPAVPILSNYYHNHYNIMSKLKNLAPMHHAPSTSPVCGHSMALHCDGDDGRMVGHCLANPGPRSYAVTAQNNNMLLMALKLLNISQIWLWLFAIILHQYNVNTSNRNCPMSYFYCHLRPLHHSLLEITVSIKKCENGNVKLLRIFKLNAASNKIFRGLRNE